MLDRDGFRPNVGIVLLNHEEPGVLGQTDTHPFLAVPARGHQARRNARAGDVPRAPRRSGAAAGPCAHRRAHARLAALRGARPLHPARRARPLPRPEADLVPAAADRPRQRHEPARDRPPGVRRLALERVLGPARRRDRVQARRLPDGADRAGALPAARRPAQPLPALGHAAASSRGHADHYRRSDAAPLDGDDRRRRRSSRDGTPAADRSRTPALGSDSMASAELGSGEHEVVAVDQLGLARRSRAGASISRDGWRAISRASALP